VETRTLVELPEHVTRPFEVYVNGVPQEEGRDYEVIGAQLVFGRDLVREGRLGFWRWASMLLGVAGTYRRDDTIDVIFVRDGRRTVATLHPHAEATG